MNIYELNQAFNNLQEVLENTEEQDVKELIKKSMEEVQEQTTTKIENLIKYIKNLEAEAVAIAEERKRLQSREKTLDNKITGAKEYLKDITSQSEAKKIKAGIFNVSIRKNASSINVVNLEVIPAKYKNTVTTVAADKKAIKEALKNGEVVEGVELKQSESLIIK